MACNRSLTRAVAVSTRCTRRSIAAQVLVCATVNSVALSAALAQVPEPTTGVSPDAPRSAVTPAAPQRSDDREAAAEPAIPPELRPLIDDIRDAPDASAASLAYTRAKTAAPDLTPVAEAFMRRVIQLGKPLLAETAARELLARQPEHPLALAVAAYADAARQDTAIAITQLAKAAQLAPQDPFVQRTAGQLAAWYETHADISPPTAVEKQALNRIRALLGGKPIFAAAFREARDLYASAENGGGAPAAPARAAADRAQDVGQPPPGPDIPPDYPYPPWPYGPYYAPFFYPGYYGGNFWFYGGGYADYRCYGHHHRYWGPYGAPGGAADQRAADAAPERDRIRQYGGKPDQARVYGGNAPPPNPSVGQTTPGPKPSPAKPTGRPQSGMKPSSGPQPVMQPSGGLRPGMKAVGGPPPGARTAPAPAPAPVNANAGRR